MNLPNKLTLFRIILVPVIVFTILFDFPHHNLVAGLLFGLASITDMLDGQIARKRNLITDFGKFADPLADKILVISVLCCFVQTGLCDCVALIIVLFREFAVTSIRLVAASKGNVVAANIWGKIKTVTQIIAVCCVFAMQYALEIIGMILSKNHTAYMLCDNIFFIVGEILIWVSVISALISGVIYIIQNKKFISQM